MRVVASIVSINSVGNPAHCASLTPAGRQADPDCGMSGMDRYELGIPDDIYYGSGGGTNNADAAASFSNVLNTLYIQDEFLMADGDLTVAAGLRYDWFVVMTTRLQSGLLP